MEVQLFTLPSGTLVKRNGLPFRLLNATVIKCHPGNWEAIQQEQGSEFGVARNSASGSINPDKST